MQFDATAKGGWKLEFNVLQQDEEVYIRIVDPTGTVVDNVVGSMADFSRGLQLAGVKPR